MELGIRLAEGFFLIVTFFGSEVVVMTAILIFINFKRFRIQNLSSITFIISGGGTKGSYHNNNYSSATNIFLKCLAFNVLFNMFKVKQSNAIKNMTG